MELIEKACLLCFENSTVISQDGSKNYFKLLSKDNYCCNNLNDNKFHKLFESKCVCITCAYKIDKAYNLIQHIVNNNDNYFNKSHSKNKCGWCHNVKENLLLYVNYTDEFKDVTNEFIKSVTKKEFELNHRSSCMNCSFSLLSWNFIKNAINSIMDGVCNVRRTSKSLDDSKNKQITAARVESKMPKIKLKTTQTKHIKPVSKKKKCLAVERKIEIEDLENKLKHLKSGSKQAKDEEFTVDRKCADDQKMWFDIPYVKIDFEDIQKKRKRIKNGDESSESEVEYVEASTSSAPTKPPVRRKKSWNNQHFSENDISNEEATPKKKNKRVSFADSIEIKNLSPESGEDTSKKQNSKSQTATKRNLRVRKSDTSEEDTPKKKTKNKSSKSIENDIEPIKYKCSICDEEFSARCYQKLHEFEHNMNFSPVILLDTTAIDNMQDSKKMNGYMESEANDADDESTTPGKSRNVRYNRRTSLKNKRSDEEKSNSEIDENGDKNEENDTVDDFTKIEDEEQENKMEGIIQIDDIINKIDDSSMDAVEEDADYNKQKRKDDNQNGIKKKKSEDNNDSNEDKSESNQDKNKSDEIKPEFDKDTKEICEDHSELKEDVHEITEVKSESNDEKINSTIEIKCDSNSNNQKMNEDSCEENESDELKEKDLQVNGKTCKLKKSKPSEESCDLKEIQSRKTKKSNESPEIDQSDLSEAKDESNKNKQSKANDALNNEPTKDNEQIQINDSTKRISDSSKETRESTENISDDDIFKSVEETAEVKEQTQEMETKTDETNETSESTDEKNEESNEINESNQDSNKENEDSDKENKQSAEVVNEENEDKNFVASVDVSTNDTDSVKSVCGSDEGSASKNVVELNENDEAININEDLDDTLKVNEKSSLLEDISDGEIDDVLIDNNADDMVSLNDKNQNVNGTINHKIDHVLNTDDVIPDPTKHLTQPTDSQSDLDNVADIITDGDNDSDSIHLSLSSDFFSNNTTNDNVNNDSENNDRFKEVESLLEGLGA